MTIEEAIGLEKREQIKCENDMKLYKRKLCRKLLVENSEYHRQIAEWLEELKVLRLQNHLGRDESLIAGRKEGYNKAIDDLLGGMNQITYNYQNADELFEKICDLAEQLKAGK